MVSVGGCFVSVFFVFVLSVLGVNASFGDRSTIYRSCCETCIRKDCIGPQKLKIFQKNQPLPEKLLFWSCEDECRYQCMWQTVDIFTQNNQPVPQFHGKWPFIRLFGIQEPASMIFSVMNGIAHIISLKLFVTKVPSTNRLFYPSLALGIVMIIVWVWSSIFHTREFPFTEKMDYFSATAAVLCSIYYCIFRISLGVPYPDQTNGKTLVRIAAALILVLFFIYHVSYLTYKTFDYGYNMFVNVVIGLTNGAAWIFYHWLTRKTFSHQWKASFIVVYTSCLLAFELLDFVPLWWTFDAHCLWHLGTVIFPFFWYSFLIDECSIFKDQSNTKTA
ncbi:GPI-specific phospholipase A2-like PGAP3 [Styela clava]